MSWYLLLKLTHVVCAIAFLSGLIGRGLVRRRLPHITSLDVLREALLLVGRFDELLVIRGGLLTLLTGLLLGWGGQWPYLTAHHPTWIFVALALFLSLQLWVYLVFLPRGKAFAKVMQLAIQERNITPALRASLADPVVRAATIYEAGAIAVVLGLMVLKPF
ncbi:MAG TPA: DUF2269 family protein [Ktedonobacterales bacterium]